MSERLDCPACDASTETRRSVRDSNPWGWLCLVAGCVLLLVGLCAWPLTIVSVALVVVGSSLRQPVAACGACGHVLRAGKTRLGAPSKLLVAVVVSVFVLNGVVCLIAMVALYHRYLAMINQF